MSKEFKETTKTWKSRNRPNFSPKIKTAKNKVTGEVSTTAKVYRYVSEGTKRHFVAPKNGRALAFRSKYTAKTSPGRIPARSGGGSGGTVFSRGHWVKGINARKFDEQIKDDTEDRFNQYMNQALENAILEVS